MRHVEASLSARKDGESSFLQCGSGTILFMCVKHRRMQFSPTRRYVQACFSSRKDIESRFHHCTAKITV